MISPLRWSDILFFLVLLVPNLVSQISVREFIILFFLVFPYVVFILPFQILYDRLRTAREWTVFQNLVLRCVRFSFGNINAIVGRVFFSESQAFPFIRLRTRGKARDWRTKISSDQFQGSWICDPAKKSLPTFVIFYLHGGGFTLGSTAFYFEFLMNLIDSIPDRCIKIFSLDYDLVPESRYPTQLQQAARAYDYLLNSTPADKIIFAGDSAGAAILISLLFHIAKPSPDIQSGRRPLSQPKGVILISPWCQLDTKHQTLSRPPEAVDEDYLDISMLHEYARLYTGATKVSHSSSLLFPLQFYFAAFLRLYRQLFYAQYTSNWISGAKAAVHESQVDPRDWAIHSFLCKSPYRNPFAAIDYPEWLADAFPINTLIVYGGKEVMAGDITVFTNALKKVSKGTVEVRSRWEQGWHVWPLVLMYLGKDPEEASLGIKIIEDFIKSVTNSIVA